MSKKVFFTKTIFCWLLITMAAFPRDLPGELFSPALKGAGDFPDGEGVIRSRLVTVNFSQLPGLERAELKYLETSYPFCLNLFVDVKLRARIRDVTEISFSSYCCKVDIEGVPDSRAVFVIKKDIFSAYIMASCHFYLVRPVGKDIYKIEELDHSRFVSQRPIRSGDQSQNQWLKRLL